MSSSPTPKKPAKRPAGPRVISASFVAGASELSQLPPPTGVEIAFAGRSNVGKSSLMNHLMGRKNLVRTSSTPGCTRQISFFEAKLNNGALITLVDLPGYGYAKRSKTERGQWADLIETYLLERPTLAIVNLLVDFRRGVEADDADLLTLLAEPPRVARRPLETLIVATKLDKLSQAQRKPVMMKISQHAGRPVVPFSIRDEAAPGGLWKRLLAVSGFSAPELENKPEPEALSSDAPSK